MSASSSARTTRFVLASAALLAVAGSFQGAALAATFRVPQDFATIQEAVTTAATLDTVAVAPGTYSGPGNREIQFLGKDVRVIGTGGSGSTILDCEGAGRGFDIRGGESNAALIQGLTIRDGAALAINWPGAFAAGISCRGLSHPTIRDVVFEGCNARRGGGLGCADSSPIVEDCVFKGNSALNDGGGVLLINFSDPVLERCVITGNAARVGGGVGIDLSAPIFRACTVASNSAVEAGGGMYVEADVMTTLERVLFAANCAPLGPDLALAETTSDVTLDCCALSDEGLTQGPGSITEIGGRVLADPLLCLPAPCSNAPHEEGEYGLAAASPCLPGASPCGLLIGARGEECGVPTGIGGNDPEIRVESASWGGIKAAFGREP